MRRRSHGPFSHGPFSIVAHLLAAVGVALAAVTWSAPGRAAEPGWPPTLTVLTASPGGTYHVYGAALAKILSRDLDLPVAEQTTEGPAQNIQLMKTGQGQIGFVTMGVALQAWNGTGDWTHGREFRDFRALFPMYDTPFHFVAIKGSGIVSLADLSGKSIGVGPEGGTAGTYVPRFLAALNIQASTRNGTWEELAAQLEAGTIDVLAVAGGVPFPVVAQLEAKKRAQYVQLTPDEILKLRLAIPELNSSTIPAGSYPSLMTGYQTVGLYNFAVANKEMPVDLAYEIVSTVFGQRQELIDAHPAAAATIPANFAYNTFLPFHPGALRYYGNVAAAGRVRTD